VLGTSGGRTRLSSPTRAGTDPGGGEPCGDGSSSPSSCQSGRFPFRRRPQSQTRTSVPATAVRDRTTAGLSAIRRARRFPRRAASRQERDCCARGLHIGALAALQSRRAAGVANASAAPVAVVPAVIFGFLCAELPGASCDLTAHQATLSPCREILRGRCRRRTSRLSSPSPTSRPLKTFPHV
jgi:hypothetical protein